MKTTPRGESRSSHSSKKMSLLCVPSFSLKAPCYTFIKKNQREIHSLWLNRVPCLYLQINLLLMKHSQRWIFKDAEAHIVSSYIFLQELLITKYTLAEAGNACFWVSTKENKTVEELSHELHWLISLANWNHWTMWCVHSRVNKLVFSQVSCELISFHFHMTRYFCVVTMTSDPL